MSPTTHSEITLFDIAGIRVAVDLSWLIVFGLVFWSLTAGYFPSLHPGYPWAEYLIVGLGATLCFFASVLLHELSHALVAKYLGETVERITLFIFGGMAHMRDEPASARNEFLIAGAGPLASLALGALFWLTPQLFSVISHWPMWHSVFVYLGFINLALAVFNLLPGFPLDGGRLLRAVLWARSGDFVKATARAAGWGRAIAYGLMGLGAIEIFLGSLMGGLWLIFVAFFLRSAAIASYQSLLARQVLEGVWVKRIMAANPIMIPANLTVEQAIEEYFLRHEYHGYPVTSDGKVVGLISLGEVRDCPLAERNQRMVGNSMRPLDSSIRIASTAPVTHALEQMFEAGVGRLLVIDGGKMVGMISRSAIARRLALRGEVGLAPAEGRGWTPERFDALRRAS
jgi:Zn-dependent protease/CBS domain-containing protein